MDSDPTARSDGTMKVFLVEDSAPILERLCEMVGELQWVEIVGHAATCDAAVSGILSSSPDVVILDIKLADNSGSGIDVLARVKRELPALKAIMLSNYASPEHLKASIAAGADYFLDKSVDFSRITAILELLRSARGSA